MNSDLISREALRAKCNELIKFNPTTNRILELIDNAPTVEITDYDTGYQDGLEDGLNDIRPQGKWKEYKLRNDIVVEYAFKCSNCKKDSGLLYHADFCPNCGADMRGKEE